MKSLHSFIVALLLFFLFQEAEAGIFDFIVDPGGAGDFATISEAIAAVPEYSESRTTIFIYPGVYQEKIIVPPSAINVSLIGEDPGKVIISWDDYAGKDGMSGAESYTFWADADDFYAENITFRNTAGNVGQALAIRTTGDRGIYKNCRFIGFQDTYYAHKRRQFNTECYVEGATDFIYGDATAVFENCTINCVSGGQYISAPADTKLVSNTPAGTFYHGLLFKNCTFTAVPGVPAGSYYLGRPWQPDASSVFISCRMDTHIKKEGWSTWSGDNHLSGCYAEYDSKDLQGNLLDISQRVDWSKQLTEDEVEDYYNLGYFLQKSGVEWDPLPMTVPLESPSGLGTHGHDLYWNPVEGSEGYLIYRNDSLMAITDTNGYIFSDMPDGKQFFTVRSVSENGNLSIPSGPFGMYGPLNLPTENITTFQLYVSANIIRVSEPVDYEIYSITGMLISHGRTSHSIDISNYCPGIYLTRLVRGNGEVSVYKIKR